MTWQTTVPVHDMSFVIGDLDQASGSGDDPERFDANGNLVPDAAIEFSPDIGGELGRFVETGSSLDNATATGTPVTDTDAATKVTISGAVSRIEFDFAEC